MRECGDCSLCCKLLGIEELNKPAGKWCDNVHLGKGCEIYENRPHSCRVFTCGWLSNETFGDHWRPTRCKMVVCMNRDASGDVLQVYTDPSNPNGYEKEPFATEIQNLVTNGLGKYRVEVHTPTAVLRATV